LTDQSSAREFEAMVGERDSHLAQGGPSAHFLSTAENADRPPSRNAGDAMTARVQSQDPGRNLAQERRRG
jgi:hypothetical protein